MFKYIFVLFLLALAFLWTGQYAAAINAGEKLEELEEILVRFEIDKAYRDEPDNGYVQVTYPVSICNKSGNAIARARAGEEFKVIGIGTNFYLIEFEMRGRLYRGYILKTSVRRSALSAEGRTEFDRILKQYKLIYYNNAYVYSDLVVANNKILQGHAKIRDGQDFIRRGETISSKSPIGDAPIHQSSKVMGQKLTEQGDALVTEGEKLVKAGEEMIEKAKDEDERTRNRLSLDLEKVVETAFEDDDFDEVAMFTVIARALGVDTADILDYDRVARKVKFYVSEFESEGDMAVASKKYDKAVASYHNALELVPDNRLLRVKLERAKIELNKEGLVEYEGKWVSKDEAERLEMESKGLVKHGDEWITPEEKKEREQSKEGKQLFEGIYLTPEQIETQKMTRDGYEKYNGKWMKPEEIETQKEIEAGMVQLPNGKWVPKEDKEAMAAKEKDLVKYNGQWMTPEEKEQREREDQGLVEHRGQWVNAEKLEDIQKKLNRVYKVDPTITIDELKALLRPKKKLGSMVNWEVTIQSFTPKDGQGVYSCDQVEFEWETPPSDMKQGAKARVVGELTKFDSRKVGKNTITVYVLEPLEVIFDSDPDYIYY